MSKKKEAGEKKKCLVQNDAKEKVIAMHNFLITRIRMLVVSACQSVAPTGTRSGAASMALTGLVQSLNANTNPSDNKGVSGVIESFSVVQESNSGELSQRIWAYTSPSSRFTSPVQVPMAQPGQRTQPIWAYASPSSRFAHLVQVPVPRPGQPTRTIWAYTSPSSRFTSPVQVPLQQADLNDVKDATDQLVKEKVIANSDGSFVLASLDIGKPDDIQNQNVVEFQGVTTSAVGSDNKLNFKIGIERFSFVIGQSAGLKDFNFNAQSIGNNVMIKAKVVFNGDSGTVISVDNAANS